MEEIPSYIRIVTITGIVFLAAAFFISLTLASYFDHPKNDEKDFKSSQTRDALIIVMAVFAGIGFFLSCFVYYGHYLRSKYDPKSIIKGPVNVVSFPAIDEEIPVNDLRDPLLLPRPRRGTTAPRPSNFAAPKENRLRKEFL